MSPHDPPPPEPSPDETERPEPIELDSESLLTGEVSGEPVSSRRNSGGGLMAALGLIVPVVLGGVTVFGVYFLFLEDLLKKPPPRAEVGPSSKTPAQNQELREREQSPVARPQPTFVQPDRPKDEPVPDRREPSTAQPANTAAINQAEHEAAAEKALRLAKKMLDNNPSAAAEWHRKVVKNFPNTQAAQEARDWLKQQADAP